MRRNFFGQPIVQPDDDLNDIWFDTHTSDEDGPELTAMDICQEQIGEAGKPDGWSCTVDDQDGNSLTCADFDSEADLRAWLSKHGVEVVA